MQPAVPQLLDWADATTLFSASVSDPGTPGTGAFQSPSVNLEQTRVRFWAVRGAARSVQINYKGSRDAAPRPFLLLTTTDPRFVPGMGELAMGDSVFITVRVDTRQLKVSLEPTGLQFGAPATLTLWYGGANRDEDRDETDLGLWYREDQHHSWSQLAATQSLAEESFTSLIPHFSDYAVARYSEWSVGW